MICGGMPRVSLTAAGTGAGCRTATDNAIIELYGTGARGFREIGEPNETAARAAQRFHPCREAIEERTALDLGVQREDVEALAERRGERALDVAHAAEQLVHRRHRRRHLDRLQWTT